MTKKRILASVIWFISAHGCNVKNTLIIPKKHVSVHLEESLPANVFIKNKGVGKLEVSVNYAKNQRQISGFGLDGHGTGEILIKKTVCYNLKMVTILKKWFNLSLKISLLQRNKLT